eukprot:12987981-Alexandrium_andersonii.AAC.1
MWRSVLYGSRRRVCVGGDTVYYDIVGVGCDVVVEGAFCFLGGVEECGFLNAFHKYVVVRAGVGGEGDGGFVVEVLRDELDFAW